MSISFNEIPSAIRVPFFTAEFDASEASQGPSLLTYTGLLIGQKLEGGSAEANSLHRVFSVDDVIEKAGRGSMLHRQAIAWFASNTITELWIGVLDDDSGGAAASGSIEVTEGADEDGTIALYLGGQRITVGVSAGDSAGDIAGAIEGAINAESDLPVTASEDTATVTVTFRHDGEVGNDFDIRHSHLDGEELPDGVALTVTGMADGESNPSLDDLIAAMGDKWFHIWAHPYTDSTNLDAIEAELADRFGPLRMIDGLAITSATGSLGDLATLGDGRNSPHSVILAQPGESPLTPPMEFAAEAAGIVARFGQIDPARPFQTLAMSHAMPPAESDLFTKEERGIGSGLLFDGIATTVEGPGGVVQLERVITTYQETAAGSPDTAYLDSNTLLTLMFLRFDWRNRTRTKFPRHKLADDGTRFGPGQAVVTPKLMKGEALRWFRDMELIGLVQNFDQFKEDLISARNEQDPNRLDLKLSPNVMNQLMVKATQFAFRL